jgi:biopolymer transport protein ExbB
MEFISLWQLILMGGAVIWPIILCSIFALAVTIDRFNYFYFFKRNSGPFVKEVFEMAKKHQIKEALDFCERSKLSLANVLKIALLKYDRPRSQIKEAMEDSMCYETAVMQKGLPILYAIFHVAPLLGFLGTIVGLAEVFHLLDSRAVASETVLAARLLSGIWKSFIPAIAGLITSIPVFLVYRYFLSCVDGVMRDTERSSTEFLNLLTE